MMIETMENEKRPNLLAKIVGNTWDKDGEPVFIETEDQCRGLILFVMDEDSVHSRMYGDVCVADIGSVIYMLKESFGDKGYELAAKVADEITALANSAEAAQAQTAAPDAE